ncbi:MAG: tRNA pseudouridine(38-40) synthase TruA, partial [Spartobacteria bacterium]
MKLIVAYDGAGFSGWQIQARGDTIQHRLEAAFFQVTGEHIRVHGAGRTDACVHALGQCAHVDLPPTRLTPAVLVSALNASLPPRVRVLRASFVAQTFHARFKARGKVYRYRIATTPVFSPFEIGRAWHVTGPLDDKALRAAARAFVGKHNFAGFAANRGHPVESTIRTIQRVRVQRSGEITTIEFDGDGFLYKMVRLMAGAIIRAALGKTTVTEIRARLADGAPAEPR